jgi:cell division protein DivIC
MLKKILHLVKRFLRNYYLPTLLFFVVWMLFFDSNNAMNQLNNRAELMQLLQEKEYYESEIAKNKAMVQSLTNPKDTRALEKFGREKYLMKKPNEEIFLIIHEGETPTTTN